MKKIIMIVGGYLVLTVSAEAAQPAPSTGCASTDKVENALIQTTNEMTEQISGKVAARLGLNRVEGGSQLGLSSPRGLASSLRIAKWTVNCKNGVCGCQYFNSRGHLVWKVNVKGTI